MAPMARLRSSLLGYRVTEAKRRYGKRGVSSGPILTWGIWRLERGGRKGEDRETLRKAV